MGRIEKLRVGNSIVLVETIDLSQIDQQEIVQATGIQEGVTKNFDKLLEIIKPISESISNSLEKLTKKPSSASAEFGLSFAVEGSIVLVKASSEASIKVTMTWDYK